MNNRKTIPIFVYLAVLLLLFSWASGLTSMNRTTLSYSQVVELFQKEQVKSFVVKENTITLELRTPINGKSEIRTTLAQPESFRLEMHDLLEQQRESGVLENFDFIPDRAFSAYDMILPLLIVGVVLLVLWTILVGKMNGSNPMANFGKA